MRSTIVAVAAALLTASGAAHAFPYQVHVRTLDNGARAVVVPMPSEGAVATAVWVAVGSGSEVQEGRTGFAHFFEHLAFSGTEAIPRREQERRLLRLGIADNAWTWLDETVYHATADPRSVEDWMTLQADLLQNLKLTQADIEREAGAVYGEYRKTQADPGFHLEQAVRAAAFTVHPYGHDTLGIEADIAAMPTSLEAAREFYTAAYRPENTTVLLVGDIERDAGLELIERLYAGWSPPPGKLPEVPVEPPMTDGPRRVQVDWPSEMPPQLMMAWRIPADRPTDPEAAALAMADALLLGSAGRLQNRLVREENLAYRVFGGRDPTVDPGLFSVYVHARPDADRERIEAVVREELASLVAGVDPALLERTRSHTRYSEMTGLDDPENVLEALGFRLRRGADPADLDAFDRRVLAVDADALSAVVDTYLGDATLTLGWVGHGLPPLAEPSEEAADAPD